jgi:hypothetical protein
MIKTVIIVFTSILLGGPASLSFAQDSDRKVVISGKEEIYTYEFNKNKEVQVNAEYTIHYKSIKPSTVSFVEYYDNYSEIRNIKIKGIKKVSPQYGMYKQENIFFSDAKACYFDMPFVEKDSEATVTFSKLFKDIRKFGFLPLAEPYYTNSRTIKIVIPDWMDIDVLSRNLSENIIVSSIKDEVEKNATTIINITDQPEYIIEENTPHYMHSQPYVMIIPGKSSGKNGDIRYFKTMDDLYQWSKEPLLLIDNDMSLIKEKASELTINCISDEEKIRELCKWVQQKIRYIAFTDGLSAYKPDNAQDVIAKKYGDCKGMSNLLKSLLLSEGFDARLVWVATADLERDLDIVKPIPFANHMICALYRNDSLYYFDPTVKSLIFGETPEQLQGQMALIEDGENYIVSRIPQYGVHYNRDSLFVWYSILDDKLIGKATRSFKGESKHSISYWVNNMTETEKRYAIEEFLKSGESVDSVFAIQTEGLNSFLPEVSLTYEIGGKSNINIFGNQIYINLDGTKDYRNAKIDTVKRKTALKYPYKDYMVRVSEFLIPEGYDVEQLPPDMNISREKYAFSIVYIKEKDKIIYHKEIAVFDPVFEKTDFEQWNSDIDILRKSYSELVVLGKK